MASRTPSKDTEPSQTLSCRRYGTNEHAIAPGSISADALAVYRTLRDAGHEAYLVGGCVRDLLLGREPKDFDVCTSARPEEVHELFRRSRIVGRRFQIVHVRSGRETIEVSTFRAHQGPGFDSESDDESDSNSSVVCPDSGMLLRDNVFGSVEEDALRRDFTVNGLYYDPDSDSVLDFNTGVEDLAAGVLRVIGNPATRYQEDPVRMLRAVRFSAKLGFRIEADAADAIKSCRKLLSQVAAARMFDEVLKLLLKGQGEESFAVLEQFRLFELLFPQTAQAVEANPAQRKLLTNALRNSDDRIAQDKPVTPAFLFAAMLWPALCRRIDEVKASEDTGSFSPMQEAIPDVIRAQTQHSTIPRRFATPMREIWEMQHRLVARRQPQRLATHPRFRAAYDFLLLREQAGEQLQGAGDWWTAFQAGGETPATVPAAPAAKRRRRRGRRTSRAESA